MNTLYNSFLSFYFLLTLLYSVSAPPFPYEVKQPDGSKISVRMFGHEYYNWMETEDGHVIDWVEDDNRLGWYYCDLNSEGNFFATHILVEYPAPDNINIPRKLKESNPNVRKIKHSDKKLGNFHNANLKRSTEATLIKPLVFLVNFKNLPSGISDWEYSPAQFQQLLFDIDLESDASTLPSNYNMSVRDYYHEISNGKLEVYGDDESIRGWTEANQNYSYYVDGEQGTGSGTHGIARSAAALVVEIAMKNKSTLDFSNFDGDEDGVVDLVILIVEGWGNGDNDQFWPHMSMIHATGVSECRGICEIDPNIDITSDLTNDDGYFSLDGKAIKKYILIPEQYLENYNNLPNNPSPGLIHPIGTICHEMGHVLGLPDLYDTSENSAAGIGEWGLMGSGNWLSQTRPAYMSAWSRNKLRFIEPIIKDAVLNNEEILLPAESGEEGFLAMILPMDSNIPQEYLILENRQPLGSDKNLKKSGLLVWHIDETITGMYPAMNSVNVSPEFYGVNLLQADGKAHLYSPSGSADAGDPFPNENKNVLTGNTNPNTNTYSYDRNADGTVEQGGTSGIAISNIIEGSDGLITFSVTNPNSNGKILGYDEGGYDGISYDNSYSFLQWAGVRFEVSDTALLSGVETVFPPSFWSWDVTDYTLNIWDGWINNKPQNLLYTSTRNVNWDPETYRYGGWAHISLLDETIVWNAGETYYVEVNYNGTGGVYPFDKGVYSNSLSSNFSYFRGNTDEACRRLTEIADADWNIRAVLSGKNCGEIPDEKIWPGDMNGDLIVDADDIIPLGIYFESQGCYRLGDAYLWEAQPYPDGWDMEEAARADANGDGFVNIADLLVILVSWNKEADGYVTSGNSTDLISSNLEDYRSNFHQLYESMSGDTEPEVLMRGKLEEIFEFEPIPTKYILKQNYPNPFNARTTIPYFIADEEEITISIYDMRGRIVENFNQINNQEGWHDVVLNADNMSSGIYFYRLVSKENILSQKKMLLMK